VEKALLEEQMDDDLRVKIENLKVKSCGRNCKIMCCRRKQVPQKKLFEIYKKSYEEELR